MAKESGVYRFRISFTNLQGEWSVEYFSHTIRDQDELQRVSNGLREFHKSRASGQINVEAKLIVNPSDNYYD